MMGRMLSAAAIGVAVLLALIVGAASARPSVASATNTWQQLASLPQAEGSSVGAVVGGRFYVLGPTGNLYRYDPGSDSWTTLASSGVFRTNVSLVAIGTKLYVAGGCLNSDCAAFSQTAQLQIYDTSTNTWSSGAAMPAAREGAAAAALNGKFYVVSGWGPGYTALTSTEVYDPSTDSWSQAADLPENRYGASAVVANGSLT